jgi:predicted PurR-regulated permease PerM
MWQYMILVVAIALIIDQIFDSMVAPRILGKSLGVHPAAVLIAALVGANLIGIVGIVLASPVLATLTLWGKYVTRKMLDLEPWPEPEQKMQPIERSFSNWGQQIWQKIKSLFKRNREE